MRYSTENKYRRYVKGYRFLSFANHLSDKYGQKLVDSAKKQIHSKLLPKGQFKKQLTQLGI